MRNKEFKKLFKEEFKKENSCKVTLEDVLPETELKTYNDNIFQKYKRQQRLTKYFALNSLITVLVLIISIIGFTIKLEDFKSHQNNYPTLSTEAKEFMIDYCGGFDKVKLISYECLQSDIYFMIYSNSKKNTYEKHDIVYFYFTNSSRANMSLKFNDKDVVIDTPENYGLLGIMDSGSDSVVCIEVYYDSNIRKIVINEQE